jgi:hypothetical protein
MSLLPQVTEPTRERVAREFDDLGPGICVQRITEDMRSHNPELLDMAEKCSRDIGDAEHAMVGLCMFYRLLTAQWQAEHGEPATGVTALPCVSAHTRDLVTRQIDESGEQAFVADYLGRLERDNPELLQMAHGFASRQPEYLRILEGIALLWAALITQLYFDRTYMH